MERVCNTCDCESKRGHNVHYLTYTNMSKYSELRLTASSSNMERTDLAGCWPVLLTNQMAAAGFSQTSAAAVDDILGRPRRVVTAVKI